LAKEGISVQVLDSANQIDNQPRATHYSVPALKVLKKAGLYDDVREQGFTPDGGSWRKADGTPLCVMKTAHLPMETRMACLPLNKLCKLAYEAIQKEPTVEIKWSHKVTGVSQDKDKATVDVETPSGPQKLEADYVVGCDGASSQIRRSLFGDMEFPGFTWDEQLVATNVRLRLLGRFSTSLTSFTSLTGMQVYYDMSPFEWEDSNFVVDKKNWYMVSKIQPDGLYRVTYNDTPGLTRQEYIERQPMRFEEFLPGNPKPDQYKLVSIGPYKVHQRCATSFRVGRCILAADAAHLCNPL